MTGDRPHPAVGQVAEALRIALGPEAVQADRSLARYTALRVGGPADLLVKVESIEMLRRAVATAWQHRVPCCVLGGGSNVLIGDAGWRGLVVLNRARAISFSPSRRQGGSGDSVPVRAASGAAISTLARQCAARGLAGLEWAAGIPGTVGGAVVGNAGAWGSDVASTLTSATILEPGDVVANWPAERFQYGYRTSILKRRAAGSGQRQGGQPTAVVLDAGFALHRADKDLLGSRLASLTARRKASQPPGASCGSVFKNPPGDYAGRLIEAAGLKGARRGAAEISPLHANFVVNHGGASAADVKALIDLARERVQAEFGIALALEIELVGDW